MILVVIALHQAKQINIHVFDDLQQFVLALVPCEMLSVNSFYVFYLLWRQYATIFGVVLPAWICRFPIRQALIKSLEDGLPFLFIHFYPIQEPWFCIVTHVSSQNVVLTN